MSYNLQDFSLKTEEQSKYFQGIVFALKRKQNFFFKLYFLLPIISNVFVKA